MATVCTDTVGATADQMAPLLGLANGTEVLTEWAKIRGTDAEVRFAEAQAQVVEELDPPDQDSEKWDWSPPTERSLDPIDVPEYIREQLDVRAAFIDVSGLDSSQAIMLRTATGVSSGITAGAMGDTIPLFFVAGSDTFVEITVTDFVDSSDDVAVLASADLKALGAAAGIDVTGTIDDVTIDILDRDTVTDRLGLPLGAFDTYRTQYLNPAGVSSVPGPDETD